jgi:hypothetical protein
VIAINFPDVKFAASKEPTKSVQATLYPPFYLSTTWGTGAVEDRTIDRAFARRQPRIRV